MNHHMINSIHCIVLIDIQSMGTSLTHRLHTTQLLQTLQSCILDIINNICIYTSIHNLIPIMIHPINRHQPAHDVQWMYNNQLLIQYQQLPDIQHIIHDIQQQFQYVIRNIDTNHNNTAGINNNTNYIPHILQLIQQYTSQYNIHNTTSNNTKQINYKLIWLTNILSESTIHALVQYKHILHTLHHTGIQIIQLYDDTVPNEYYKQLDQYNVQLVNQQITSVSIQTQHSDRANIARILNIMIVPTNKSIQIKFNSNNKMSVQLQPVVHEPVDLQPQLICKCHGDIAILPNHNIRTAEQSQLFNSSTQLYCNQTNQISIRCNSAVQYNYLLCKLTNDNIHENHHIATPIKNQLQFNDINELTVDKIISNDILQQYIAIGKVCNFTQLYIISLYGYGTNQSVCTGIISVIVYFLMLNPIQFYRYSSYYIN